jgi:hypothetical protein
MIEIISVLLTIMALFAFANFPLNFYTLEKKYSKFKLTFSDSLLINLVINCNFLLLLSFFKINLNFIFIIVMTTSLFFMFKNYKSYFWLFNKNVSTFFIFIITLYAISILIAKNGYLEWDGLHWIYKAHVFFQGGEYENLRGLPMDYYPHLGSYLWAFFWKNSYLQYEYLGRIFFPFIFLISIFSLIPKLSKKFTEIEKLIIVFVLGFLATNFFLFGGYQEYLIFFTFFCYSRFMLNFSENKNSYINSYIPEFLIICTSNILLWTKQEGFFYYIIINIIFLLHGKRNLINKFLYFFISLFFIMVFVYIKNYYFGSVVFNEKIINDELMNNLSFVHLMGKILLISKYFLISFAKYPIWIIIFVSIFVLKSYSNFLDKTKFVYTFLFLSFSLVYSVYLQTTLDIAWLLPLTLNRLVFALSGFFIFLPILMLNKIKK